MNTFTFTETQVQVLKNFCSIFPSVIIYPDKTEVINAAGSVIGIYKFTPNLTIESPFGIHELNDFLSVLSFYKTPTITVEDRFLNIFDGTSKTKYFTTPLHHIPKVLVKNKYNPQDIINKLDEIGCELEFALTTEKLSMILKLATILKSEFLYFESIEGAVKVTVGETLDSSDNSTEIMITDKVKTNKLKVPLRFNINELKLMLLDYDVRISSSNMSQWTNTFGVDYFIGCCVGTVG